MPTTITSAGITFNDATSLTSGTLVANSVGTTQLAVNSVTAAKLGTTEQKQICKAWVNFDGTISATWAGGTSTVTRASGSTTATVTTASAHGLTTGNSVYALTGVVAGTYTVTVLTTTTFTITTVATTALSAASITFQGSTIRSSYNVSSITKNGQGDYTMNFAAAMADVNYSANVTTGATATTNARGSDGPKTTANIQVFCRDVYNNSAYDAAFINVTIFGN